MDSGTNQYGRVFKNVFFPGSLLECRVWFSGMLQGFGLWQHMVVREAAGCSDTSMWKSCGHSWWDHSWAAAPLRFYSC